MLPPARLARFVSPGAAALALLATAPSARAAAPTTIVSLSFDDTFADTLQAEPILAAHGVKATFFVNSSRIGKTGYMTVDQIRRLASDGHEIGGHTLTHSYLTIDDADEQKRDLCSDRASLLGLGFDVQSFAYPHGAADDTTRAIAKGCGYNSARGISSPTACVGCIFIESAPPPDPYYLGSTPPVLSTMTIADLENAVAAAEAKPGGWAHIVMHHVCDGCNTLAIAPATLDAFLAWLTPRAASGTQVRLIRDVIGGTTAPPPPAAPAPPAEPVPAFANGGFESWTRSDGDPDCWETIGDGTAPETITPSTVPHSGKYAVSVQITAKGTGAQRLATRLDLGECAPPVTPGVAYDVSAWYMADVEPQFEAYYRDGDGFWQKLGDSPKLRKSTSYVQGSWTTPAVPAGGTALAISLAIIDPGTLTFDDVALAPSTAAAADAGATAAGAAPAGSQSKGCALSPASRAGGGLAATLVACAAFVARRSRKESRRSKSA